MKYDVNAQGQRILKPGREEGVVAQGQNVMPARNRGDCLEVLQVHQRVGGRFGPDKARLRRDGVAQRLQIAQVHKGHGNPLGRRDFRKQPIGAAVQVVMDNDVVARPQ